jgi:molybdopterin-dependent oxidoreductase alpha subunit
VTPRGETPPERNTPQVATPPAAATGITAVVKSAAIALGQMGVARSLKTLTHANQMGGFDCPSCAWPEHDDRRTIAEFCENGAKAMASEATRERATPEFFAKYSIDELATWSDKRQNDAGRLTHPLVRREGGTHCETISWDEAFALIAEELNGLASPDEATFYTSGRTSNEAAFLYQLFVRQFGTNNLPDCSNMCHESSGYALLRSIGVGKGTVKLEDFEKADSIWVIGQNPGTNHPRMLTSLQAAARNGCEIVSVNPLREVGLVRFKHPQEVRGLVGSGTKLASLFVRVRIGGDLALLKGVMKEMLGEDERTAGRVLHHEFLRDKTEGFEAFARDLRAERWETIVEESGVSREVIREAAAVAMRSERMIVCWAMGLTQHEHAVGTIQTVVNFALLRGQIGREGAGVCPVRGHSNVQGDRTMGISEKMPEWFMAKLGQEFAFKPPRGVGLDVVESIRAMHDGRVKVLVAMGGNLLSAAPDTRYTAEAIGRTRLSVQISTKLNRGHLVTGRRALILPCLGRTERDVQTSGEQFVTVENSMGKVHASRGVLEPASGFLLSEPAIVCRMARAVFGTRSRVPWERFEADYGLIRERISRVVPGFDDYSRRAQDGSGFYLPNAAREGLFNTDCGRARFFVHPIPRRQLAPGQLHLMTIRTHDQFNTTVYGEDDRYRGIKGGRRVVFANPADITKMGLRDGQRVDITGHDRCEQRVAKGFLLVAYDIPPGCAASYFPEANVLVPIRSVAEGSNQPASKSVIVTLSAARDGDGGGPETPA